MRYAVYVVKKMLLTLPEKLVTQVKEISKAKTKSQAVTMALEEFIRDKKLNRLLSRFGRGFGISQKDLLRLRKEL